MSHWSIIFDTKSPEVPVKTKSDEAVKNESDSDDEDDSYWLETNRHLAEHDEWFSTFDDEGYERWDSHDEYTFEMPTGLKVTVGQRGWVGGGAGIALRVWEGAIALCEHLTTNNIVEGKTVLDLGSGTGITGLVAAELGAVKVLITDLPEVMDLLTANASKHQLARAADPLCISEATASLCGEIVCQSFDWSEDPSSQDIPLSSELCIFSECLYDDHIFAWLRDALLKVVPPGGTVLFSYRVRIKTREEPYFEELAKHFDITAQLAPPSTKENMSNIYICVAVRVDRSQL